MLSDYVQWLDKPPTKVAYRVDVGASTTAGILPRAPIFGFEDSVKFVSGVCAETGRVTHVPVGLFSTISPAIHNLLTIAKQGPSTAMESHVEVLKLLQILQDIDRIPPVHRLTSIGIGSSRTKVVRIFASANIADVAEK